jgi:hypothetical protein
VPRPAAGARFERERNEEEAMTAQISPPVSRRRRRARPSPARERWLARYCDGCGRQRELLARATPAGSVLVIDRDAHNRRDCRLLAHLFADEPRGNADIVARCYLQDRRERALLCRPLAADDELSPPLVGESALDGDTRDLRVDELVDRRRRSFRLEAVDTGMSIPELRWRRSSDRGATALIVSLREVVASLESYEPHCSGTALALRRHGDDPAVSTTVLRCELERVRNSPIVLNRRLREAVLETVAREGLSFSEIATRCQRVKRDARGNQAGETSWLARRIGLLPEGGRCEPTPWVHSDVLALIARKGLGVSPREVEL